MKKLWFLILLGVIFACSTTNAELKEQSLAHSILNETKTQAKIMCKIIVKRHALSDQSYEPVDVSDVTVVQDKTDLPVPADYIVLGSMTVEAGSECKILEITDAIKSGAGTFGANYVLPMKGESVHDAKSMELESTITTYILLRKDDNASIM